eukprot:TRINITY_DN34840_c0_g1_i1.p1 TRINITY_DN34840_c0_g1~~TRINITY_DN34840_c0_g1_i1.p1  ORF type:complete len:276 (+),score=7.23 TRINITY_DN34840_c0_g1_i1:286-1113(+)
MANRLLLASVLLLVVTGALGKGNGGGNGGGGGGGGGGLGGGGLGGGKGGGGGGKGGKGGKLKITGAASAKMKGDFVVDSSGASSGDPNATGLFDFVLVQNGTAYDLFYQAGVLLTKDEMPTGLSINVGANGTNGDITIDLTADATTWDNTTDKVKPGGSNYGQEGNKGKGKGRGGRVRGAFGRFAFWNRNGDASTGLYAYFTKGVVRDVATRTNAATTTWDVAAKAVLANPGGYYGLVKTATYTDGAVRGQFKTSPKGWGVLRNSGFCVKANQCK